MRGDLLRTRRVKLIIVAPSFQKTSYRTFFDPVPVPSRARRVALIKNFWEFYLPSSDQWVTIPVRYG
jgi:hypothetical protein